MRLKVGLIPDINTKSFLLPLPDLLNKSQDSFEFVLVENSSKKSKKPLDRIVDMNDILPQIHLEKKEHHFKKDDLLIKFINKSLESRSHFLHNLFIAGTSIKESPPRVAVISTSFIRKHILPIDPTYSVQKHAFYHLVLCCILGAFLEIGAHEDCGCLLDFNSYTPNIEHKINTGYSFCENCNQIVENHKFGKAIMQICGALKTGTIISHSPSYDVSRPKKIFLCYSRGDNDKVDEIYKKLTSEGFKPWMDKRNLIGGQDWELEVEKAIKDSDYFIACLSNNFRKPTFANKEIKIAFDYLDTLPEGQIFLIPLRIEECTVDSRLSKRQIIDIYAQNGFKKLLEALRHTN
ncbi:MAG: toll/interleukin-1 receptor domain-containing protein [Candidatus Aminicenantes bacterium]|nr:toll/interleukin-1 receptor domain-containing protein [Candidatus Aminicenantes bacterium]